MLQIRLRELRKEKRLTQQQLSKITNLSQCYISKLEKDGFYRTKSPTLETLETIAHGLGACYLEMFELSCSTCNKPNVDKLYCCQKTLNNMICRLQNDLKEVDSFVHAYETGEIREED